MSVSQSHFHDLSGIRYHIRTWGSPRAPAVFLLHGWMDMSASWQFLADQLADRYYLIAPDWRGFGLTGWAAEGYWFPDYLKDLHQLIRLFQPHAPVQLVGHSMGGNVAGLYAGVFPARIKSLVSLEGFGLPSRSPDQAPGRYQEWINRQDQPPTFRNYADFAAVAERLRRANPRLAPDKAAFLAPHWAEQVSPGEVKFRSDPRHKMTNPVVYRLEESMVCWRNITAPVLWVAADQSGVEAMFGQEGEGRDLAARTACFRDFRGLKTITGAGHMFHHEQPEQLAAILLAFLPLEACY